MSDEARLLFGIEVERQAARLNKSGIRWRLRRDLSQDRASVWIECLNSHYTACLIAWEDGGVDLHYVDLAKLQVRSSHHSVAAPEELEPYFAEMIGFLLT